MILVTRDKSNSSLLSKRLEDKGFKTFIFPLFEVIKNKISKKDQAFLESNKVDNVIVSSANVISYLKETQISKSIQIFVIGDITASKLVESGYHNLKLAYNNADSLLYLAKKYIRKEDLTIYLSGEKITLDISNELQKSGFKSKRLIAYKIKEEDKLSSELINKITKGKITKVTIYSKNTAQILHKLLLKHNLLEHCKKIELLCLSFDIVNHCKMLGFPKSTNIKSLI